MSKELLKANLCGLGFIGSAILTRQLNFDHRETKYYVEFGISSVLLRD